MKKSALAFLLCSFTLPAFSQIKIDLKTDGGSPHQEVIILDDGGFEVKCAERYIYDAAGNLVPKPANNTTEKFVSGITEIEFHDNKTEYEVIKGTKDLVLNIRDFGQYYPVTKELDIKLTDYAAKFAGGFNSEGKPCIYIFQHFVKSKSNNKPTITYVEIAEDRSLQVTTVESDFTPDPENTYLGSVSLVDQVAGTNVFAFKLSSNIEYFSIDQNGKVMNNKKVVMEPYRGGTAYVPYLREVNDEPGRFFCYEKTLLEIPKSEIEKKGFGYQIRYVIHEFDKNFSQETYTIEIPADLVSVSDLTLARSIPDLATFVKDGKRHFCFSTDDGGILIKMEENDTQITGFPDFSANDAVNVAVFASDNGDVINAAMTPLFSKEELDVDKDGFSIICVGAKMENEGIKQVVYLQILLNVRKRISKARVASYNF